MQESLNVKSCISNHCSGLLIKTSVPNFNSDFGFILAWCQNCHYYLPWMTKIMIPLGLNGKWQTARSVSKHKAFHCICGVTLFVLQILLNVFLTIQSMSTLKTQKIYDLFCMNVPCVFLKHAHWDLKKDGWVILGLISGNCIYWHQRKWQFFLKYWWHEDLWLAFFLRQAAAIKKPTCTIAHTLSFF